MEELICNFFIGSMLAKAFWLEKLEKGLL